MAKFHLVINNRILGGPLHFDVDNAVLSVLSSETHRFVFNDVGPCIRHGIAYGQVEVGVEIGGQTEDASRSCRIQSEAFLLLPLKVYLCKGCLPDHYCP